MNRIIREAKPTDITDIMQVMEAAKKIMRSSGNMHQWGDGYPSEAVIFSDMEKHGGFVIEDAGRIVGYFAFLPSPEPTYSKIFDGKWIDDTLPYHVVHRIASYPEVHGIFSSIMDFCFSRDANICIDTHRDNLIMQHNIEKHGFIYCGIIYLVNGDERLAFQKLTKDVPDNVVVGGNPARTIKVLKHIALSFVTAILLLCSCGTNAPKSEITAEMAYEGVSNYCHSMYDWSMAKEDPSIMYVQMGEETDSAYQVVFRSYTGAFVNFYVDKASGTTRMEEYVPTIDVKSDAGTIDIFDYIE